MHVDINITQIALMVLITLGFGLLFERLKQPAVLGYIVGGVLLSAFDLVQDRALVGVLAELGVIMLLYLIGLELSLKSFKKIWFVSLLATLLQIGISSIVVLGLGKFFDLPLGLSITLAFSIALSSTAVAIKMLESIGELRSDTGRLAVGVLIAQDLAVVPLMLFIRGLGSSGMDYGVFIKVGLALLLLAGLIFFLLRKESLRLPFARLYEDNEDLQSLVAMLFCFGAASLAGLLGLSAAYGAFLGGLVVGNSMQRSSMLSSAKPIQSVLMMVFFVSVGLLLDFKFIWDHLAKVLTLLFFITIGKTAVNISILHILRQSWSKAFLAGLILSQMGEFAFVLANLAEDVNAIDAQGKQLIISLAALSLVISPLWLLAARRLHDLGPLSSVETADELLQTAYGPQMRWFEHLLLKLKSQRFLPFNRKKGTHSVLDHEVSPADNAQEQTSSSRVSREEMSGINASSAELSGTKVAGASQDSPSLESETSASAEAAPSTSISPSAAAPAPTDENNNDKKHSS